MSFVRSGRPRPTSARIELLEALRGPWAAWDLERYADAMRATYQALDITSLEPVGRYDPDADTIKLRDVFIPQHARRSRPSRILPRDYLRKLRGSEGTLAQDVLFGDDAETNAHWEKTPREPIFDILTDTALKHLVILGDPGAGKSCLARYIGLSLLEGFGPRQDQPDGPLRHWVQAFAGRLPFLIELRRFLTWEAKNGEGGFLGYLHHLGSDRGFGLNRADLDRHLRTAPSLLIFDGLDEVIDPKKRDDVAEAITGFARTYAPTRVIVTSRIAGFDQRPFIQRTIAFNLATLEDLDLPQIETFCKTWFALTRISQTRRCIGALDRR
jgi:predicted NACHT family NTPase